MASWSRVEDKIFEKALLDVPEGIADRWWNIANYFLPGRSAEEVEEHYTALLHDIAEIEAGRIEPPFYSDKAFIRNLSVGSSKKKGTPWTEEEHKLFLSGLKKYGKGDWRAISRNAVPTRTPTQVASHAQKYFLRQNLDKNERKRSSIHDITTTLPTPPPNNLPKQAPVSSVVPAPMPNAPALAPTFVPIGGLADYNFWN